jgi:hypothetical protein
MRSGSNFANNYRCEGGGGGNYKVLGIHQLVIYAIAHHLIFLFHAEIFARSFHTRTAMSSHDQQAGTTAYISINSNSEKVYRKQLTLCDLKDANLNSKEHNIAKLFGFSKFSELQQKHHVLAGVV